MRAAFAFRAELAPRSAGLQSLDLEHIARGRRCEKCDQRLAGVRRLGVDRNSGRELRGVLQLRRQRADGVLTMATSAASPSATRLASEAALAKVMASLWPFARSNAGASSSIALLRAVVQNSLISSASGMLRSREAMAAHFRLHSHISLASIPNRAAAIGAIPLARNHARMAVLHRHRGVRRCESLPP